MLIAFDQALNVSGYAIFKDGSLVSYNKFSTTSPTTSGKLVEIRNRVIEILEENKPKEVAIEEIQLQQIPGSSAHGNVETFKKLAYVQAIMLELFAERGIVCHIVPSSTWKSACKIKGKSRVEQKRNAQTYVLEEFGIKAIQDIVDAICIGKYITIEKDKEINWE